MVSFESTLSSLCCFIFPFNFKDTNLLFCLFFFWSQHGKGTNFLLLSCVQYSHGSKKKSSLWSNVQYSARHTGGNKKTKNSCRYRMRACLCRFHVSSLPQVLSSSANTFFSLSFSCIKYYPYPVQGIDR